MKVLVTGSRKWTDRAMVFDVLDTWRDVVGIDWLIEGCAKGADALAERTYAVWPDLEQVYG